MFTMHMDATKAFNASIGLSVSSEGEYFTSVHGGTKMSQKHCGPYRFFVVRTCKMQFVNKRLHNCLYK